MANILELDDYTFDKNILSNEKVSLVDFWAPWCGPCKILTPILEEVSSEIGEKALVAKVNVDENPIIAGRYKVMSIPTILIFKNGKIVDQMIGIQPKDVLIKRVESAISN
uniref:Thioredoxin n=1 Tax=candidate division CPR3 bacterium TaxID=2268181 RepID=A0A7C4RAB7_UNCC3